MYILRLANEKEHYFKAYPLGFIKTQKKDHNQNYFMINLNPMTIFQYIPTNSVF